MLELALGSRSEEAPVDLDAIVFDHFCEHDNLVFVDDAPLGMAGTNEVLGRTELLAGRISVCSSLKARDIRRFRFTVAHELGHWVLHRPLVCAQVQQPGLFSGDVVLVTTASSLDMQASGNTPEEWQANYFASHLLLPRKSLRREFGVRFGTQPFVRPTGSSLRECARHLARSNAGNVPPISITFQASIEATAIALEECGLVVSEPLLL